MSNVDVNVDEPDIKVIVDLDDEDDEDDEDEGDEDDEGEEIVSVHGKNVVVNRINKKYDVPYSKLKIAVKYVNKDTVLKVSDGAIDAEKVLGQCEEVMDKESYKQLKDLIKSEFTGVYKYIKGSVVLKVRVCPNEDEED